MHAFCVHLGVKLKKQFKQYRKGHLNNKLSFQYKASLQLGEL